MDQEIQEVEMTGERGDAVTNINIDAIQEETDEITEIENFAQQRLTTVPGEPFGLRLYPITRLPDRFHEAHKGYYEPGMVSIGPYHHGKGKLRAMEEHKWSTLRDFMARNSQVCFRDYFKEIRALEQSARMCYSETVNMTSDEFVMMLILDGSFILEYFWKALHEEFDAFLFMAVWAAQVPVDMLLLENQIPFFIIHKLYDINVGSGQDCEDDCPLIRLMISYLRVITPYFEIKPPQKTCDEFFHLLHLYYTCLVTESDFTMEHKISDENISQLKSWYHRLSKREKNEKLDEENSAKEEESAKEGENTAKNIAKEQEITRGKRVKEEENEVERDLIIPCASELCEAGVTFKCKRKPRDMFDISFKDGVIEMPLIGIDFIEMIIFSNVVAFEQSQLFIVSETFSSYLALMDALVNTEKDVTVLQRSGILDNFSKNEVDAAEFFNHFAHFYGLDYKMHYFRDLFIKVRKYSNSTWHRYKARLMRDYFNNPWTIISVVAAGMFLILTFVQTYYTVYSGIHN